MERPKDVAADPGTCGGPCTGRPRLAGWGRGPGAGRSPGARGTASCLGRCLGARPVGAGRPGFRSAGVVDSANSWGFPGSCRGGLLSRISPLISLYFFPSLFLPPRFTPPHPRPPPSSSWLLQCGGCGYLVNCNCGPLQWERSFLSGFDIYGSKVF